MHILLVDDEKSTIDMLQSQVNWNRIGIDQISTAYSSEGAKEIFKVNKIDIILCDIEMPKESGIELLEWIRVDYPSTICIFLTNHLEFNYAQCAIRLSCFDYISKLSSINLIETILQKAVNEASKELYNRSYMIKNFLNELISGEISSNKHAIANAISKYKLGFTAGQMFYPLMFVFTEYEPKLQFSRDQYDFININVLSEIFFNNNHANFLLHYQYHNKQHYVIYLNQYNSPAKCSLEKIQPAAQEAFAFFRDKITATPTIYIESNKIPFTEFRSWYHNIIKLDENNVLNRNRIITLDKAQINNSDSSIIHLPSHWYQLLAANDTNSLLQSFKDFMHSISTIENIRHESLEILKLEGTQLFLSVLHDTKISASPIFSDSILQALELNATVSVTDYIKWFTYCISKVSKAILEEEKSHTISSKMAYYIEQNYSNKITREDVANYVHLSPNHTGKIFIKSFGMSISDYLNNIRINYAKRYLQDESYNISDITEMVGFEHFSYFSTIFKSIVGMTPSEYRQSILSDTKN
jgi:Response regulator containing CheY-like receiver domain and AraC-type DNA-binding domain